MKIIVIVRTYNEQANLLKFVDSYIDWVDLILVQDDWSEDVDYLFGLPRKVRVSFFTGERIERKTITRAKQDVQLNGLIRWAEHLKADWIIMDDCDSFPNGHLRWDGRQILEDCNKDFVYASRLYLYKDAGHFPALSRPDGEWAHSLWAWRALRGFGFSNNGDRAQKFARPDGDNVLKLDVPPYTLLHCPWADDQIIAEKRMRYTEIYGNEYNDFDPLKFGGSLEPLPEWAEQ